MKALEWKSTTVAVSLNSNATAPSPSGEEIWRARAYAQDATVGEGRINQSVDSRRRTRKPVTNVFEEVNVESSYSYIKEEEDVKFEPEPKKSRFVEVASQTISDAMMLSDLSSYGDTMLLKVVLAIESVSKFNYYLKYKKLFIKVSFF